jgi:hypothetical protein
MSVGRGQRQGRSSNLHTGGGRSCLFGTGDSLRSAGSDWASLLDGLNSTRKFGSAVAFNAGGIRPTRCRRESNPAALTVYAILIQRKPVIGAKGQFKDGAKTVRQGDDGFRGGRQCPRSGN